MKRKLPSLLALRYFEAVGRKLSFTLAADELSVTQAAVSHQVRLLEEELGLKLFTRLHQRIELTDAGLSLLDTATQCLDRLSDTIVQLQGKTRPDRIHLSTTPLFSSGWLLPRLAGYLKEAGHTEIILHHSLAPPNDLEPRFDLKIFFTTDGPDRADSQYLFSDRLVPICTPALSRSLGRPGDGDPLAAAGIVHEFNYDWWRLWCERSGLDPASVERGIILDDPAVLENAALLGHGIILGSTRFLAHRLKSGDLVLPFGSQPAIDIHYHLMARPPRAGKGGLDPFRRWIVDQCAAERKAAERQETNAPGR